MYKASDLTGLMFLERLSGRYTSKLGCWVPLQVIKPGISEVLTDLQFILIPAYM